MHEAGIRAGPILDRAAIGRRQSAWDADWPSRNVRMDRCAVLGRNRSKAEGVRSRSILAKKGGAPWTIPLFPLSSATLEVTMSRHTILILAMCAAIAGVKPEDVE